MPKLSELYENQAIRKLGEALGKAIGDEETRDYASLIDLEFAQDKVSFTDAIHRFMRRFLTFLSRKTDWESPSEAYIVEVMRLVDACANEMPFQDEQRRINEAIRLVRAALLSHALAHACRIKREQMRSQGQESREVEGGEQ